MGAMLANIPNQCTDFSFSYHDFYICIYIWLTEKFRQDFEASVLLTLPQNVKFIYG